MYPVPATIQAVPDQATVPVHTVHVHVRVLVPVHVRVAEEPAAPQKIFIRQTLSLDILRV